MARKFFVGGNYKLNPSSDSAALDLGSVLSKATLDSNVDIVVAPPTLYLLSLKSALPASVQIAAQNAYFEDSGAFTGEISPLQLKNAQIPWVLLGHSERRTLFHESSELVAKKTVASIKNGLDVILCIGETLQQREAGQTAAVNEAQLGEVVKVISEADWSKIVIAYEPVWAIGTGKVATPAQAQEAHADIRKYLAKAVSEKVASETRIIYGGSVNAKNSGELAQLPDVDGFLVGGASLKPEFVDIVNAKKQ
ncbi:triosephosphate isomerase [Flagelloscypha sp. PMI_526]|nr:triosephosphate isomerase [Flagelloscypha sp. PMI_526]